MGNCSTSRKGTSYWNLTLTFLCVFVPAVCDETRKELCCVLVCEILHHSKSKLLDGSHFSDVVTGVGQLLSAVQVCQW